MAELKAKYTVLHDMVVRYAIGQCGDTFHHVFISSL